LQKLDTDDLVEFINSQGSQGQGGAKKMQHQAKTGAAKSDKPREAGMSSRSGSRERQFGEDVDAEEQNYLLEFGNRLQANVTCKRKKLRPNVNA